MNGALGYTGVLLGFCAAVVGIVVIATGLVRHRESTLRGGQAYAPLILLGGLVAVVAMEHALLTHDFSLTYVADNNSRSTPALYSITGLWSALAGSILLWAVVLGGYASIMVWRFRRRASDPLVGWATLVVYVVAAFFFGLMLGPANPFSHVVGAVPHNGLGPNTLLQDNPLVLIHPPMLYLGFVGFTLPFAFAIATLATGRVDEDWQGETRRWTLFAWAFLTMGIILGAWWSYEVLGWGGFWSWDPVENAALMPWLVGTAYLHSVMVQERRGLLRIWNLSLVVAAFSLTILGTFLTRSGVIQSVHSFSESTIGPLLLGFFCVVLVTGVGLIAWRGDRLRSAGGIDAAVSREGAFLVNNLLFVAFAFVVLLGTVFPLLYQALNGDELSVGRPVLQPLLRAGRPRPLVPHGRRPGSALAKGLARGRALPSDRAGGCRRGRGGCLRGGRSAGGRAPGRLRARCLCRRLGASCPLPLGARRPGSWPAVAVPVPSGAFCLAGVDWWGGRTGAWSSTSAWSSSPSGWLRPPPSSTAASSSSGPDKRPRTTATT